MVGRVVVVMVCNEQSVYWAPVSVSEISRHFKILYEAHLFEESVEKCTYLVMEAEHLNI